MVPLPGTIGGKDDPFLSTHWSVVLAAGESTDAPEAARVALAQLCQTYWAPLYTFVRHRGYSVHDSQDLTQSFFAYLIEQKIYARVDRRKGKFRSFLLASLKNFLSDAYDREHALKRGGDKDFLPLLEHQAEEAESFFQSSAELSENKISENEVFEQNWAETLVTGALKRVRDDYKTAGRRNLFDNLQVFVMGSADPLPTYDELAARLGIPASTLRSHVTRLRSDYRGALRMEVRRTVNSESEVDEELRELLRVLKGR